MSDTIIHTGTTIGPSHVVKELDIFETDMRTVKRKLREGLKESIFAICLADYITITKFDSCTLDGWIKITISTKIDVERLAESKISGNSVWVRSNLTDKIDFGYEPVDSINYLLQIKVPYTEIKDLRKYRICTIFHSAVAIDNDIKL